MADKRRARQGSKGGNLTPEQARKILALPVYAVLRGQAVPIFPTTNLASTSGLVGIFRKPGGSCRNLLDGKTMVLPVWVNDRQWERAVVPVLLDPRFTNSNPTFVQTSSVALNSVVDMIGDVLAVSFHEAGYGPLPDDLA